MDKKIRPLSLRRMAGAVAASYDDDGAIILTVGEEGTRLVVEGLSPQKGPRGALCLAIPYNFTFQEEDSTFSYPTSHD